jgi:hypothetical protein
MLLRIRHRICEPKQLADHRNSQARSSDSFVTFFPRSQVIWEAYFPLLALLNGVDISRGLMAMVLWSRAPDYLSGEITS